MGVIAHPLDRLSKLDCSTNQKTCQCRKSWRSKDLVDMFVYSCPKPDMLFWISTLFTTEFLKFETRSRWRAKTDNPDNHGKSVGVDFDSTTIQVMPVRARQRLRPGPARKLGPFSYRFFRLN